MQLRIINMNSSRAFAASIKIIIFSLCCVSFSYSASAAQSADTYKSAFRYNKAGQMTGGISPQANNRYIANRYTYNSRGEKVALERGYLTSWQNDSIAPMHWTGFVVKTTERFTYHTLGQLKTRLVEGASTSPTLKHYEYDGLGRLVCEAVRMNPNAYSTYTTNYPSVSACQLGSQGSEGPDRITKYIYGDKDRISRIYKAVGTNLEQIYAQYSYNGFGELESVTDANGNLTRNEFDGFGRIENTFFPEKLSVGSGQASSSDYETYTYDDNGNRTSWRKRDGRVISYTYDKLNRMLKKDIPGTSSADVYYGYDNRDLQTYARFSSKTGKGLTTVYDGFGRVTTETNNTSGRTYIVKKGYDGNDNLSSLIHPDNKQFSFHYDQLDRVTSIFDNASSQLLEHKYDNHGLPDELKRSNSTKTSYEYNNTRQLSQVSEDVNNQSYDVTYRYNYNRAGQVKTINISKDIYHHTGNSASIGEYKPNGLNQYTHVNGVAITHDKNGNLTKYGGSTYKFDIENRLTSSSVGNVKFYYDPMGKLYRINANGKLTDFVYAGDSLIAEYTSSGSLLKRYIHGQDIDTPLVSYNGASTTSSNRQFLHKNHQGSIVLISNSSGGITQLNTYDEFGNPGTINNGRFGYTGQVFIAEAGLYYYKARIYHPKLGRFLQTDPVGYEDQTNLYAYVGNDPVNMVDPSGMTSEMNIELPDVGEVIANALGFENTQQPTDAVDSAIDSANESLEPVIPSRETAHTIGTVTAVTLTVAAVTTPCTVVCAQGALAISSAQAADNLSQGKPVDAALNMLPAGSGKLVSTVYKGSTQLTKAQAGAIADVTVTSVQEINKR